MLTMDEVNSVQDQELKDMLLKFNRIHNLEDKKFYMISDNCNDNDYSARLIIDDLAQFLYRRIVNPELIKALNISDDFIYHKKKEISKAILLSKLGINYTQINSIAFMPSSTCPTGSLIEFILKSNLNADKEILNALKNFIKNNKLIIEPSKSIYLPLEDEKRILKQLLFYKDCGYKNPPQELVDYVRSDYSSLEARGIQIDTQEEANKWARKLVFGYFGKRIGNIGEYFYQDALDKHNFKSEHVAKDDGDGFGYDHHCLLLDKEVLYETKATIGNGEEIKITENEYNTMIDCINLKHTNHYISHVFIDRQSLTFKGNKLFKAKDENLLIPYNCDGSNYKYDHIDDEGKKVFVKQ